MKDPIIRATASLSLLLAFTSACDSGFENKPAATVQAQTAAVVADTSPKIDGATRTLALVAEKSEIGFVGAKITGKHTGKFRSVSGEAKVVGNTPKQVSFTVPMASIESDDEKLTGHLKGPDFFDVEKYPTSTFQSTSIIEKRAGESTHEITGNLSLHGVTKTITFPAKVTTADDGVTGTAEFTINRKDFGVVYPGKPDDLIKDDVLLSIKLVFPKP
jgi:polyisoprenoid-binding protein YceI